MINRLFKSFLVIFCVFSFCVEAQSVHVFKEAEYQKVWCKNHNGVMEYKNVDNTRVDCLTDEYAVEFDFAQKWAESVGQALYYGLITGKKPKVVLILENPEQDRVHFFKTQKLAEKYCFDIEYMTTDDVKIWQYYKNLK